MKEPLISGIGCLPGMSSRPRREVVHTVFRSVLSALEELTLLVLPHGGQRTARRNAWRAATDLHVTSGYRWTDSFTPLSVTPLPPAPQAPTVHPQAAHAPVLPVPTMSAVSPAASPAGPAAAYPALPPPLAEDLPKPVSRVAAGGS